MCCTLQVTALHGSCCCCCCYDDVRSVNVESLLKGGRAQCGTGGGRAVEGGIVITDVECATE